MALHRFVPDHYHTTLGSHPPVLHVAPGDSIETSLVDAAGCDASGQAVAPRGNPQTGPFFVEGAEPGDTLVVRIDRLWPNRERGYSAGVTAPHLVDPGDVPRLPTGGRIDWAVDRARGVARPLEPPPALADLVLPLAPMLGCFGVAPPGGQAISTATSGPYGGNMDYRGFTAGVQAFFPVFVPGALFFVGDGHALQGDGESLGTGIEISMDVTFTLDLRKGQRTLWPRGDNGEDIFTVGNARPLEQALQHAMSEMLRWLEADYGLGGTAAHLLLGQCVRYDVGNVFDPAFTMVCRLSKRLLEH